jgi:hypothetical protein
VTVTVLAGTDSVIVGEGCVVVTVTVSGWVAVLGCVGGACDVSVGVVAVAVVRVEVVRVVIVGAVRVDVRVPIAALLPPPHDESAKPASASSIAAAASPDGRTGSTPVIISRRAGLLSGPLVRQLSRSARRPLLGFLRLCLGVGVLDEAPAASPAEHPHERHDPEQDVPRRRDELLAVEHAVAVVESVTPLSDATLNACWTPAPPAATEVTFAIELPPVTGITVWNVSGIA